MHNILNDSQLKNQIEIILSGYLKHNESLLKYRWDILPGSGSTSVRALVSARVMDDIKKFVVKQYLIFNKPQEESREQAIREYKALQYLSAYSGHLWHSPHVIALIPDKAVNIMSYEEGDNISNLFWHAIRWGFLSRIELPWLISLVRDIAIIINEIQSLQNYNKMLNVSNHEWYSLFLDEHLYDLKKMGIRSALISRIRDKVYESLLELLNEKNQCFQHTDLYFNNILYCNKKYCIFDLPNACWGSRYWDISHLLMSLEDYKLYYNVDRKIIDACKEEFIRSFNLDQNLIEAMQLIHSCFSFKLNLLNYNNYMRRLFIRNPIQFYNKMIKDLLKD